MANMNYVFGSSYTDENLIKELINQKDMEYDISTLDDMTHVISTNFMVDEDEHAINIMFNIDFEHHLDDETFHAVKVYYDIDTEEFVDSVPCVINDPDIMMMIVNLFDEHFQNED